MFKLCLAFTQIRFKSILTIPNYKCSPLPALLIIHMKPQEFCLIVQRYAKIWLLQKESRNRKKQAKQNFFSSEKFSYSTSLISVSFPFVLFSTSGIIHLQMCFYVYYLDLTILISLHKNMHQGASHNFSLHHWFDLSKH